MSYNRNWNRWIKASMFAHILTLKDSDVPVEALFVEGTKRKTNEFDRWFELRMNGPFARKLTKSEWRLDIEFNIMCSHILVADAFKIDRMLGWAMSTFTSPVQISKLGEDPTVDDQSVLGCMQLNTEDKGESIKAHQFGQVDVRRELIQATAAARYILTLEV